MSRLLGNTVIELLFGFLKKISPKVVFVVNLEASDDIQFISAAEYTNVKDLIIHSITVFFYNSPYKMYI